MTSWLDRLTRVTPAGLAPRAVVLVAVWVGLWLAIPAHLASPGFALVAFVVALIAALGPGSRLMDAVMLGIVAAWMFSTLGLGEPAEPVRTFATGAALYLAHSAAAMAAALPADAVVDGQVLLRWAARSALVLAAAGLVTVMVVLIAPAVTPSTSTLVLLIGLAAAAGVVGLLARGKV